MIYCFSPKAVSKYSFYTIKVCFLLALDSKMRPSGHDIVPLNVYSAD